jgi:hypothetical protein
METRGIGDDFEKEAPKRPRLTTDNEVAVVGHGSLIAAMSAASTAASTAAASVASATTKEKFVSFMQVRIVRDYTKAKRPFVSFRFVLAATADSFSFSFSY